MAKRALLLLMVLSIGGSFGCKKRYGKKITIDKLEVYYKGGVSKETATRVGDFLVKNNFTRQERRLSVQITKVDGVFTFRMVTKKNYKEVPGIYYEMRVLMNKMSLAVFNGAPLNYDLCDDKFKTIEGFTFRPLKLHPLPGLDLEYEPPVTKAQVTKLGAYLVKVGFAKKGRSLLARLTMVKGRLTFLFFVKPDRVSNPKALQAMQHMGKSISKDVFGGKPVDVHMTNKFFKVLKKVPFQKQ